MVDRGRARDVNEAAARFAETLAESYRLVYGQAAESAERQQQRAQAFSELVSSNLREQSEAGRANAQQLSEQAKRQREAYAEFLDSAFSRYRAGTEQATRSAQAGVRTLSETTAGLLGTATGAVDATVEGAEQAAEAVVFPIEDYDELNVEEVSGRLDDLSVKELQLVRDYEELNEKRRTLLEQMDRKIRSAS
jgi:dsDNA-specific endonuclease/ATPase MutS2